MQKLILVSLLCLCIPVVTHADFNGSAPATHPSGQRIALPTDGVWHYWAGNEATIGPDGLGGWMFIPPQSDLWVVTGPAQVDITDAWNSGDVHVEVWVDGVFAAGPLSGAVAGFNAPLSAVGVPAPFPAGDQMLCTAAFNDPNFSSGSVWIGPGAHTINIKTDYTGSGYTGGGHCIRAQEPLSIEGTSWGAIKAMFD